MEVIGDATQLGQPFGLTETLWHDARRLITRYQADRAHSFRVCAHALSVYTALADLSVIEPSADLHTREALALAALLHDIGHYIADRGHHRHSSYLILHSEVSANWHRALKTSVAALALTHRKKPQKTWLRDHFAGNAKLLQAAAILRLADGLDRGRDPLVQLAFWRREESHVTLTIRGLDEESEARILKRKADLWTMAFGHSLYLNRRMNP